MEVVQEWMAGFLAKPHPGLGREGDVCPFVRHALKNDLITVEESDVAPYEAALEVFLIRERAKFTTIPKPDLTSLTYLSTVIVLPKFRTLEHATMMDRAHSEQKIDFMEAGLMIGQFHPYQDIPGLHNGKFTPNRCPVFCFAIRNMIREDVLFIPQNLPAERVHFAAEAYARKFGDVMPGS